MEAVEGLVHLIEWMSVLEEGQNQVSSTVDVLDENTCGMVDALYAQIDGMRVTVDALRAQIDDLNNCVNVLVRAMGSQATSLC